MGPEERQELYYFIYDSQKVNEFNSYGVVNHPLDIVITYTEDWVRPPNKRFRCHSRKRFIKLVMSHGYSKRIANFLADTLLALFGSYQIAYMRFAMHNLIYCQE